MKATQLIGVQVASFLLALLAASFLIYGALDLSPGDPLTVLSAGRELSPQAEQELRDQYNLDDPFLSRYAAWLTGASGKSLTEAIDFAERITAAG